MRSKNIYRIEAAKVLRLIKEMRQSQHYSNMKYAEVLSDFTKRFMQKLNVGNAMNAYVRFHGNLKLLVPRDIKPSNKQLQEMYYVFAQFLKDKQLYETFIEHQGMNKALKFYTNDIPLWVSSCGFTWANTIQGWGFWRDISEEWKDFCYTNSIMDIKMADNTTWQTAKRNA